MSTAKIPELITYAEAEAILRVKRSTIQRLIRSGDLEVVWITDRTPRIRLDSVERYIRANHQVAAG